MISGVWIWISYKLYQGGLSRRPVDEDICLVLLLERMHGVRERGSVETECLSSSCWIDRRIAHVSVDNLQ